MSKREAMERQVECVCGAVMDARLADASMGRLAYEAICELCGRELTLQVTATMPKRATKRSGK